MHTINLTEEHQLIVVEALLYSLEDKRRVVLQDWTKWPATQSQYADAAEKLLGPVKCGTKLKNIFTWLIDQFEHSPSIIDTELVQHAIIICRAAAENRYDLFTKKMPWNITQ